jgi:hypothetical protein
MQRKIAIVTLLSLGLGPSASFAKTIIEPTPVEAYQGTAALDPTPWYTEPASLLENGHIIMHGSSANKFGGDWWGGGYVADYQFWDSENNGNVAMVGGAQLTVSGKALREDYDVAYIRVGLHNWAGNVVNGQIRVIDEDLEKADKTIKNWYLIDQPLTESFEKSTTFWDAGMALPLGPVIVQLTASVAGNVKLVPFVEMKDRIATMNIEPSARLNATVKAGFNAWGVAGAYAEGGLDPLVEAKLPVTSFFQSRAHFGPCFDVKADLVLHTMQGKIKVILNYIVDTYVKTIAEWGGSKKTHSLVNLSQSCKPPFHVPPGGIGVLEPLEPAPAPQPVGTHIGVLTSFLNLQ